MIIVDPVQLGDVGFTRASSKWVFDRTGALVQVAVDSLAVTYDPSDLGKAPYALVESAATNNIRNNTMVGAAVGSPGTLPTNWTVDKSSGQSAEVVAVGQESGINFIDLRLYSAANDRTYLAIYLEPSNGSGIASGVGAGQTWAASLFAKMASGLLAPAQAKLVIRSLTTAGAIVSDVSAQFTAPSANALLRASRASVQAASLPSDATRLTSFILIENLAIGSPFDFTIRIGLPQLERGRVSSPIKTTGVAMTRAADTIGASVGLVHSNVPEPEPLYSSNTSYAKDARVRDSSHTTYVSQVSGNIGNALSDITKWTKEAATNRWAMFDQYNNTQTTNAEEIVVVLSPRQISQGGFWGNLFADEIRISVVDPTEGLVFSEVSSLIQSNSKSSFFNWCFKRIQRKAYFGTLKMPPYANALITICLRKPGGVAKCGMAGVGPVDDFGPTLLGLSTEGKDFSSTVFEFDGTSTTTIRPYAKKLSCDVDIDNDQVEYVETRLFEKRQRLLFWFGGPYGSTVVAGRYSSFKNVFQYQTKSLMNLAIEGAV